MKLSESPPASLSSMILIADGEGDSARLLAGYLTHQGYVTVCTSSGEEALSRARAARMRLAIVDVALSDMSGHALVGRLREIDPAIPIIMTSADYRQQIEIEARKEGILYYAHKPTDYGVIEAVVAKAFAGCGPAQASHPPACLRPPRGLDRPGNGREPRGQPPHA